MGVSVTEMDYCRVSLVGLYVGRSQRTTPYRDSLQQSCFAGILVALSGRDADQQELVSRAGAMTEMGAVNGC